MSTGSEVGEAKRVVVRGLRDGEKRRGSRREIWWLPVLEMASGHTYKLLIDLWQMVELLCLQIL